MYKKIIRNLKLDIFSENKSIYTDIYDKILYSLNDLNCYIGDKYKNEGDTVGQLDGWNFYGKDTKSIFIDVHIYDKKLNVSEIYIENYIKEFYGYKDSKLSKSQIINIALAILKDVFDIREKVEFKASVVDSLIAIEPI